MQPSKPVEKYLRRLAKMQPKTAPLTKEERAAKAARARAARPVDPRNPTRVQLKRITGKQMRRALVEREDRVIRRAFLRLQNGHRTSAQTILQLTAKQAWGVAQMNRATQTTAQTTAVQA